MSAKISQLLTLTGSFDTEAETPKTSRQGKRNYTTKKDTKQGKLRTLEHKQIRKIKYSTI